MGLRMNVWFFHSPHQLVKFFFDKLKGRKRKTSVPEFYARSVCFLPSSSWAVTQSRVAKGSE